MLSLHADRPSRPVELSRVRAPSQVELKSQGPDPGLIENLFYHLRTLEVENTFNLAVTLPAALLVGFLFARGHASW